MVVIENTKSGTAAEADAGKRLRDAFRLSGMEAQFVPVAGGAEIHRAVDEALGRGERTIVAAGGDGSVSAVASRLLDTEATLGVIPFGTLNHFSKDLGIPQDLEDAVVTLQCGVATEVDVAEVNGRPFLNNSSLGLYPELVRTRDVIRERGYRKWVAAFWAAIPTLQNLPLVRVRVQVEDNSLQRRTPFVFIGNNLYELEGLRLGSRSRLDGGELCICVAHRVGRMGLARMGIRALIGGLREMKDFDALCAREAWVESPARTLPVSLDGEVVEMTTPLHYRIRPAALRVIAPRKEKAA
jgi:diacylglycerol kinase family enzyme